MRKKGAPPTPPAEAATPMASRVLDARPDTLDFRDRMYEPTLVEVPSRRDLDEYRKAGVPILDQGTEGACTGFGLATVANYLLRTRRVVPDATPSSPRMLYEMARRYDEWPGESYSGSSARGAMKGWHKHGVCSEAVWPYQAGADASLLTDARASDATRRRLGAYLRVNHLDLTAMHSAIAEVGILYATSSVHSGWGSPDPKTGLIPYRPGTTGGHAFAIVGYDERGFWIQNSWGTGWGLSGFGLVTYDDWLANATDVWVARLGVPVVLRTAAGAAAARAELAGGVESYSQAELRPHIISIGNDGRLRASGPFATSAADVREILTKDFARVTRSWKTKRILLYAHGGLVSESQAIQRVADYRASLLDAEVYPLSFIWKSDYWTTLTNTLKDAVSRRRPEGILDAAKDFLLDRLDDALEPLARFATGKVEWDEMKENATLASTDVESGGAAIAAGFLCDLADAGVEIHVVGHSAGSIFHAPLVQLLTSRGARVATCTLWAPACTLELFKATYLPAIQAGRIGRFALFTLTDGCEQADDCARIYNKSLLYLVSNAFEGKPRIPFVRDGVPLLGMQKFVRADPVVSGLFASGACDWVLSPNTEPEGSPSASTAKHHDKFDDDVATTRATLARILGAGSAPSGVRFVPSASRQQGIRRGALAV